MAYLMHGELAQSKTLAGAAYVCLREDILAGRLKPQDRLRMRELRRCYGLGFTPLREALMRLSSEGFVVAEDQRGFHVAPVSSEDLWDVTRTRKQIETLALRDSLEHGDDEWEARLVAAFHRLSKLRHVDAETGRVDRKWARRHYEFHYALVSGARSKWIKKLWQITYDQSDRYRHMAVQLVLESRNDQAEHRSIMEAALARDADRAILLSHRHIETTAQIVAAAYSDDARVFQDASRPEVESL